MNTWKVYVDVKDEIAGSEYEGLEVGAGATKEEAVDNMKGLVREYEKTLREIDDLAVVYWDEGTNEVWGNDGFGHYVSFSFYVRRIKVSA